MADQATTVAAFQLLCAECADLIAASDFAGAYLKAAQAEAVNAALELDVSTQETGVRRRETLAGLRKAIDAVSGFNTAANDRRRGIRTKQGFQR